ncbi:hypothetical protein TEQG_06065 [Trichophyton equinum CBS 127.97]|uniref:Uncharacterized protein n=1 Tax=Trichophyton equinum (strain ATCC MYA-4606 / CBS 127.97) TaxID=559882 RepID=F2PYV8_TRIEC|nr:hypothetical protein TEQG_06065 [Trichophyton equinum CBS 127.97]
MSGLKHAPRRLPHGRAADRQAEGNMKHVSAENSLLSAIFLFPSRLFVVDVEVDVESRSLSLDISKCLVSMTKHQTSTSKPRRQPTSSLHPLTFCMAGSVLVYMHQTAIQPRMRPLRCINRLLGLCILFCCHSADLESSTCAW